MLVVTTFFSLAGVYLMTKGLVLAMSAMGLWEIENVWPKACGMLLMMPLFALWTILVNTSYLWLIKQPKMKLLALQTA